VPGGVILVFSPVIPLIVIFQDGLRGLRGCGTSYTLSPGSDVNPVDFCGYAVNTIMGDLARPRALRFPQKTLFNSHDGLAILPW
jgi:hypothetical protein